MRSKFIRGLILMELIFAVAIGLLLLSVLMEVYLTCERSFRLQNALHQIQDNAKTATIILKSELFKAGNIGCAKLTYDFPLVPYRSFTLNPRNKLIGNNANEIMVSYAGYPNTVLEESMRNEATLYTNINSRFAPNDILLISDCKQAEIFQVSQVKYSRGLQEIISLYPLHSRYEKYAQIAKFESNKYFIANTHRVNRDGTAIYALFMEDINRHKTELVDGIHQMRIMYTINQSGQWVDVQPQDVADWSTVVGVMIELMLDSPPIKKNWYLYARIQEFPI